MPLRKNLRTPSPLHTRAYKRKTRNFKKWLVLASVILFSMMAVKVLILNPQKNMKKENVIAKKVSEVLKKEPEKPKDPAPIVADIESYLVGQLGEYGYDIIELDTGREFGTRGKNSYIAASTVKVGIAAYIYSQIEAGNTSPDKYLTYTSADYEGGTGSLQGTRIGSRYKVSYLLERMIKVSDNVATNILIRTYGRSKIQAFLDANGLSEIVLVENTVSPRVMCLLLKKIYAGELISEINKEELFGNMKLSITPSRLVAGVPQEVSVAHKIGTQSGAISDIGIVYLSGKPYAISVYSKKIQDVLVAEGVIKTISQKVYSFENSR